MRQDLVSFHARHAATALPYPGAPDYGGLGMSNRASRDQEFDLFIPRMSSLPLKDQRELMEPLHQEGRRAEGLHDLQRCGDLECGGGPLA